MPPAPTPANINKVYTDLPLQSYAVWDSVGLINQTLLEHENGYFRTSSLLVDSMLRDDRIMGVTATRLNALLGLQRTYEPSEKKKSKSQAIADDLEDCWDDIFPGDQLAQFLKWGIYLGVALAELVWDDNWKPTLKVWHPQYLYWDWAERCYYIATQSDGVVKVTPGDGKWVLFTPYGYQYGWMTGVVRGLAQPWIIRKYTYRDWARYCEIHGLPIRLAISPMDAKQEHKDRFAKEVTAIGSETVFSLGQNGKDGPNFDLRLLEAQSDTYAGFQGLLQQVEASIAITMLGQNLTTEVKSGSLAAAKVQDRVRGDVLKADADGLSQCLRRQVLLPWVRYNYSFDKPEDICPTPRWQVDPPTDKGETATAYNQLSQAIQTFRNSGVTVDVKNVLQDFDIPVIGTGIDPTIPVGPQPVAPPGQDGGDPKAAPGKPKLVPPPGKSATAKKALEILARTAPAWKQGQDFADEVHGSAAGKGAKALGDDLQTILALIKTSNSAEELRAKLLEAFAGMSVKQLGTALHKASILARMDGRWAVLEGL